MLMRVGLEVEYACPREMNEEVASSDDGSEGTRERVKHHGEGERHWGACRSRPFARGLASGRMASRVGATRVSVATSASRRTSPERGTVLSYEQRRRVPSVPRRDVARESRPDNREDGAARPVRLQELRQRVGGGGGGSERWGHCRLQGGRCRQNYAQCRTPHRWSRRRRWWSTYVRLLIFPGDGLCHDVFTTYPVQSCRLKFSLRRFNRHCDRSQCAAHCYMSNTEWYWQMCWTHKGIFNACHRSIRTCACANLSECE